MNTFRLVALTSMFSLVAVAVAQEVPPPAGVAPDTKKQEAKAKAPDSGYKKYDEVVTKEATSQDGLFKVHRIDDKILFEIPQDQLGKDMLWQTEMAELPTGNAYAGLGMGTQVVQWTRRGKKIFLKGVDFSIRSVGDEASKLGISQNSVQPLLMAFDVQTEGKDSSGRPTAVIDVTSLYTGDPAPFSVKAVVGGAGVDSSKSYVDKVKAFPENIETRSNLTFSTSGGRFGGGEGSKTALVHYSLVRLPDEPMMGRYKDSRIGFFTQGFEEYGRSENRAIPLEYIDRFRLEKKDPSAAVSDPVKPIVFYVAREVPAKWRASIKQAIEDWQPAFEQAGFSHAIIAKDAPSIAQDPDWDAEDARYSVIRWIPSTTENAMGPSIQDPRSGETLSAHVIVWNDVLALAESWYFAQAGAIDSRAHKIPFPDPLMQDLIRYVVAHEVGHTLGLEHNMKGSAWYTAKQLRDPAFTLANGVGCSIMDYSRFNYVAQPGDGVTRTIGMIGPYDKFAIEYGYKVFPGIRNPDDEKPMLDNILARQVLDPRLRFGNYKFSQDPTTQSEDICSDAIDAGTLGFANIDRIANQYLVGASTKFGEDYTDLERMRSALVEQRMLETFHITRLVGGVVETDYHSGRGSDVFAPVPAEKQRRAVQFLMSKGMEVPTALNSPRLENKLQPNGVVNENTMFAKLILNSLMSPSRTQRMFDNEALNGPRAYTVSQMVGDISNSVFSELNEAKPYIGTNRREIQRTLLTAMNGKVNGNKDDMRLICTDNLKSLAARIDKALPKTTDRMTRLHLAQCRADIGKIMVAKYDAPDNSMGMFLDSFTDKEPTCWSGKIYEPDLFEEMKGHR